MVSKGGKLLLLVSEDTKSQMYRNANELLVGEGMVRLCLCEYFDFGS